MMEKRRSLRIASPPKPSPLPAVAPKTKRENAVRKPSVTKAKSDPFGRMNASIRQSIPQTAATRQNFLVHHEYLFKPLLPESNYYSKLPAKARSNAASEGFTPFGALDEQPSLISNGQMKQYQLHGLSFLVWLYENGMNGILGDEMGLGKTLQTLSLFAYLRERGVEGPFLVICPLSVLSNWMAEIARWTPSFTAIRFHGMMSERERLKGICREKQYDIYVTSYEQFVAERHWLGHRSWRYVVVDEGHCLKNEQTQLAHAVGTLAAEYRLLLTGTPLQNSLHELWALFHFLYPEVFTEQTADRFRDAFDLTKGTYNTKFIEAASALLSKMMLRRMKADIDEIKLPPKEELLVYVPLTPLQKFWYKRLITRLDQSTLNDVFQGVKTEKSDTSFNFSTNIEVNSRGTKKALLSTSSTPADTSSGDEWQKLMNLLLQLRKVCNHPYLLPNSEPDPYFLGDHIILGSGKMMLLDKLLPKLFAEGHRVLMFSGFKGMLDVCEDFLNHREWTYARLDGATTRPRRTLDIRLFNQENSPYQVYLISTKAGGLGVNLVGADTVIFLDSDYNPQVDLQAMARCHRIGQTKPVTVYRLVTQDSVEEQALTRLAKKLYLSVKVTAAAANGGKTEDEKAPTFSRNQLVKLLRGGTIAFETPLGDDWNKKPIEEVLSESRERQRKREDMLEMTDEEVEKMERELLKDKEQIRTNVFQGKTLVRSYKDISDEWRDLTKRVRSERTVMIDGFAINKESLACGEWEAFPTFSANFVKPPKRKRVQFDHQDWCQHCREGGELFLCSRCPRVFHAECAGWDLKELLSTPLFVCPQHNCTSCYRNTAACGGMLFRCQTCADSFCEDCLPPEGEIDGIGASLPEFEVLGYPEKSQAYYIRCTKCVSIFKEPQDKDEKGWVKGWVDELEEAEAKWKSELTTPAPAAVKMKMENSEGGTPSTETTQPDEMSFEMEERSG